MLTVRNYIEAAKRRKKEETGEEGFSLIELIIVVVILGILVAIAIPIFGGIQDTAAQNAVNTAAANGATAAAASVAAGSGASATPGSAAASAGSGSITVTLDGTVGSAPGTDPTLVCTKATDGTHTGYAGNVKKDTSGKVTGCN